MVAELLVLALDYHRSPLRYRKLTDPRIPLPAGFDVLLGDFCIALTPRNIGAVAKELEVSPREIKDASLFFLRQVLLAPGTDHYRVLGLSPTASAEAIRTHYSLIVRLFHPDRSAGEVERNSVLTARINEAYNTLRASDARRRYDKQLEAQRGSVRSTLSMRDFFRLEEPIPAYLMSSGSSLLFPRAVRSVTVLALIGLSLLTLLFFAFRTPDQPTLRANPDRATGVAAGPSYLRNGLPGPFQSSVASGLLREPERERDPSTARQAFDVGGEAVSGKRLIGEVGSRARAQLGRVLERMCESYGSGEIDVFVDLFTADVITNSGNGKERVRANYTDLFNKIDRRRLSFSDLIWWINEHNAIAGQGRFRVSSMLEGESDWRHGFGTVRFELVPWDGSYRVSQMTHSLELQ